MRYLIALLATLALAAVLGGMILLVSTIWTQNGSHVATGAVLWACGAIPIGLVLRGSRPNDVEITQTIFSGRDYE